VAHGGLTQSELNAGVTPNSASITRPVDSELPHPEE
jgi:hypothetical protein